MKKNTIRQRRNQVYFAIKFRGMQGKISFDGIVNQTGFSRAEVASYIAILTKKREIGSVEGRGNVFFHHPTHQEIMDDFNEMMYGCSNPVHVFGIGYVNPNTSYGRRFVDP